VLDVVHAGEGYIKTSAHAGSTLGRMTSQLSELVALVARWALEKKYRIVTAESCTGGWIAKAFTDAAGSSRWFECGYVTYSNAAKVRDLGVASRTLDEHGAVSEPTVREMAAGALRVSGADVAIAVSGIAGPDGGSAEKPVGTVWLCVARRRGGADVGGGSDAGSGAYAGGGARHVGFGEAAVDGGTGGPGGPNFAGGSGVDFIVEGELFAGGRETVRRASVKRALELVLRLG
jgi:nicotinamide-nucleotide amidase